MRLSRGSRRGWSQPWEDLAPVEWFGGLDPKARKAISRHADWVDVAAGTRLQQQGVHARWVWVVASGLLELRRGGEAVGAVGAGEAACEVEVLLGAPSWVDVVAATPTTVISIPARAFHGLLDASSLGAAVARRMAERFDALAAAPVEEHDPAANTVLVTKRSHGDSSRD
jgi:CRP-like cAMP-binding protein